MATPASRSFLAPHMVPVKRHQFHPVRPPRLHTLALPVVHRPVAAPDRFLDTTDGDADPHQPLYDFLCFHVRTLTQLEHFFNGYFRPSALRTCTPSRQTALFCIHVLILWIPPCLSQALAKASIS